MKTNYLSILMIPVLILFTGCLPRSVRNLIPEGVDEKEYIITSLKARARLNELVDGNREDTRRIYGHRSRELMQQIEHDAAIINTKGVFFHFPTLIKALMVAHGSQKVEDLFLNEGNFDLSSAGFFTVFGKYPDDTADPSGHPGRMTCFVSFAFKDGNGNYRDIILDQSSSTSGGDSYRNTFNAGEPIMFNFGSLCPTNCPQSLGGN